MCSVAYAAGNELGLPNFSSSGRAASGAPLNMALGVKGDFVRRDLDLIRKLILAVEDREPEEWLPELELEGYTPEQIGYHSYLVVDSGLAKGTDVRTLDNMLPNWQLSHLTSAGHDFADAARSESTWSKAKTLVKDKGSGITLDVMKQVLVSVIKGALGL